MDYNWENNLGAPTITLSKNNTQVAYLTLRSHMNSLERLVNKTNTSTLHSMI